MFRVTERTLDFVLYTDNCCRHCTAQLSDASDDLTTQASRAQTPNDAYLGHGTPCFGFRWTQHSDVNKQKVRMKNEALGWTGCTKRIDPDGSIMIRFRNVQGTRPHRWRFDEEMSVYRGTIEGNRRCSVWKRRLLTRRKEQKQIIHQDYK